MSKQDIFPPTRIPSHLCNLYGQYIGFGSAGGTAGGGTADFLLQVAILSLVLALILFIPLHLVVRLQLYLVKLQLALLL